MPRNAGDYVKSWGAALIRGAASNPEFTVVVCSVWPRWWRHIAITGRTDSQNIAKCGEIYSFFILFS